MLNPNSVHQRDVTNIFSNLQDELQKLNEQFSLNQNSKIQFDFPKTETKNSPLKSNEKEEIQKKISDLVDKTEQDLRLKTHVIVRDRFKKSNALPFQSFPNNNDSKPAKINHYLPPKINHQNHSSSQLCTTKNKSKLPKDKLITFISKKYSKIPDLTFHKERAESSLTSPIPITPIHPSSISSKNPSSKSSAHATSVSTSQPTPQGTPYQTKIGTPNRTPGPSAATSSIPSTKTSTFPSPLPSPHRLSYGDAENVRTVSLLTEYHTKKISKPLNSKRDLLKGNRMPKVDRKDPQAPAPLLNYDESYVNQLINSHGLQMMNESGLIRNDQLNAHFDSLLNIIPMTPEFVVQNVLPATQQNYILDTNHEEEVIDEPIDASTFPEDCELIEEEQNEVSYIPQRKTFTLYDGFPDEDSPEFMDFQKAHLDIWESIVYFLGMARRICEDFGIKEQTIDCKIFAELSKMDPDQVSKSRLMQCFATRSKSNQKYEISFDHSKNSRRLKAGNFGFGFKGKNAQKRAAIMIQSLWRGCIARSRLKNDKKRKAAAETIQKWFRFANRIRKFRKSLLATKTKRYKQYESIQDFWISGKTFLSNQKQTRFVIVVADSHDPDEIAHIQNLKHNKFKSFSLNNEDEIALVVFSRFPFPISITDFLKSKLEASQQRRLHFVVPKMHFPCSLPLEDVIASDKTAIARISNITFGKKPLFFPNENSQSLVEVSCQLDAVIISPSPKDFNGKVGLLSEIKANILQNAYNQKEKDDEFHINDQNEDPHAVFNIKTNDLFYSTSEIKTKWEICVALADACIYNLDVDQWIIRDNYDCRFFGWITVSDIVLLNKIKSSMEHLTSKDLAESFFRDNLIKFFMDDLVSITTIPSYIDKEQFFEKIYQKNGKGVIIEESPKRPISRPSVALFVGPNRFSVDNGCNEQCEYHITGTWENLYLSTYEPFASIHPAIITNGKQLQKAAHRIADQISKERLIGDCVIDFWYSDISDHKQELNTNIIDPPRPEKLRPDNVHFVATKQTLPEMLAELISNTYFDESKMALNNGQYVYVQKRLILPYIISIENLTTDCFLEFPINEKIFFLPDLQEDHIIGMVVIEDNPYTLINLVYKILCTLDNFFDAPDLNLPRLLDVDDPAGNSLKLYCTSIQFLADQLNQNYKLNNSVYMEKQDISIYQDQQPPLLHRFVKKPLIIEGFDLVEHVPLEDNAISSRSVHVPNIEPKDAAKEAVLDIIASIQKRNQMNSNRINSTDDYS